ncbi:MAG: HAMP domain-containing sensor histidine kinase [Streptococcus sp.]|nr:HAMP domain-containing sensor histidine kinase [Streptococcus sp.]
MGLSNKGQSLKLVFFKYLLSVGVGLVLAIGLALLTFTAFYNFGLILPANYTENLILKNKTNISNAVKFNESLIPDNTQYIFLTVDGAMIQSNMNDTIKQKAIHFHNQEEISTPSTPFIEIKRTDGYIVINYSVEPHYTNNWMEKHFPKINILFTSLLMFFCFIGVFIITLIWARQLTKQLIPILKVSEKVAKQELDFEIGESNIKEFNNVLNSLNEMKVALSNSLRENWIQEENKRNQISALTHDLKTPISILQGNAELLNDTNLTEEQKSYVNFIIKNSNRISDYSKALMIMNRSDKIDNLDLQKVQVSTVVEKAREVAKEFASIHKFTLSESVHIDRKFLMMDIDLFERVLQNIFSNAVQYSPRKSSIELRMLTTNNHFEILITDQGQGFSEEDLAHGTEQFYRGDKSRHSSTNYGLGLYTARQIVKMHSGSLRLANREHGQGAVVNIKLPLINND